MYKQSPSRTQRSKGFKVKHALQICLLLAVCFWLIYQVKHYHDKKRDFDEHDVKNSLDSLRKDNVAKLGRKDLHPLKERTVVESDKHEEEVEEEVVEEETTVEQKENMHEEEGKENKAEAKDENGVEEEVDEEVEEEDNKYEEEGKENKTEGEDEDGEGRGRVEEELDEDIEEKTTVEEEENNHEEEGKENKTETKYENKEHDNLGGTTNRHEARDENYNADDASSAVTLSNGNDTGILGKLNEQDKVNNLESRDIISNSSVKEVSRNSAEVRGEVQDISLLTRNESSKLESNDPNVGDESTLPVNSNLQYSNSTISTESKSTDLEESHTHGVTDSSNFEMKYDLTSKAEGNSTMMENSSISENIEDDEAGHMNEISDESNSENSFDFKLDMEDSSDSKFSLEEKDVRTDLETLQDIKTEGGNSEDDDAVE